MRHPGMCARKFGVEAAGSAGDRLQLGTRRHKDRHSVLHQRSPAIGAGRGDAARQSGHRGPSGMEKILRNVAYQLALRSDTQQIKSIN